MKHIEIMQRQIERETLQKEVQAWRLQAANCRTEAQRLIFRAEQLEVEASAKVQRIIELSLSKMVQS